LASENSYGEFNTKEQMNEMSQRKNYMCGQFAFEGLA